VGPPIVVAPNELDDALWLDAVERVDESRLRREEVRVLYMGGLTHGQDLALLEPVFDSLTTTDGRRIVLEVVGVTSASDRAVRRIRVPHAATHYPDFVAWLRTQADRWQLGVAPLVDTEFNLAKSDLKFLEYTALGLPSILSDIGPYRGLDAVGATVVPNGTEKWREAIVAAADDAALREQNYARARQYVREERMLSNSDGVGDWIRLVVGDSAPKPEMPSAAVPTGSEPDARRGAGVTPAASRPRRLVAIAALRGTRVGRFAERAARSVVRRANQGQRRLLGQSALTARTGDLDRDFVLHVTANAASLLKRLRVARDVVIVIPVYNGGGAVRECIESIVRNTPGRRIVVLDDCSTEQFTLDLLAQLEAAGEVEVRRNPTNLGYTANANLAMTLDDSADLVLINSDTVVGPLWLERLRWTAYSMPKVAGVSAFSDSAGAYSLPVTPEPSVWPHPPEWDVVARFVAQNADSWALEGPTIHGFCCYFAREALDEIGPFDREMFPRGYGEENEWSMRALARGYLNLGAPHVFVHHAQGASFGSARTELIHRARRIIDQLHPSFGRLVNEWWGGSGFATIRINSARLKHEVATATVIRRELSLSLAEASALGEVEFASTLISDAVEVVRFNGEESTVPSIVADVCQLLGIPVLSLR
jgi:GT2 family glycosyltransferase